jgi:hypothetical protein
MRMDRIFAAAFVVLVSTAIIGFSAGNTGANFTGTSTNPDQSWQTQNVTPPAAFTSATSAIAGRIDLVWTATASPAGSHALTYLVYRGPVGGPYSTLVGTTAGLTLSDTPPADGTYEYAVQTKIAQGAGFFTSGNSAVKSNKSDRTAPTMSILCNGVACTGNANGWFNVAVSAVVTGTDGAGTGMASVTTSKDGAANGTTAGSSRTDSVSGNSASHTVAYFGTDAVGNVSGATTQTIKIDGTVPTTPGSFAATAGSFGGAVTMSFSWTAATDALSGVQSQTVHWVEVASAAACPAATTANYPNGGALAATATTLTVTGSAANVKICGFIDSLDKAGNTSAISAVRSATAR